MNADPHPPAVTHVVGRAEIDRYADLSGDFNPLHMDEAFAAGTRFGTIIAHGPIALQAVFEAVSAWLGEGVEPAGVRIDVLYRGPVRLGDAVTCRTESVQEHAGDVVLTVVAVNQQDAEVLQALVVVPRALARGRAGGG
jgi:3-hydroxybutyryl-CoA dehydratase